VSCRKAAGSAAAIPANGAPEFDWLAGSINSSATPERPVVQAWLAGSSKCSAEGITARGPSPVLALCRKLVEAGFDTRRPLHAYRDDTLALCVKSIGAGAKLTVDESRGVYFAKWRPFNPSRGVAPVRQNELAGGAAP